MKHTLIALILVLQCFTVNAQFEKNSVIAGGSGSYISRKQTYNKETRKTTTYSIDPLFLIQSSDDFSVGLALGYFYDYYKNEIDETGVANEWHVGPAIRYQKKFVDNFSGYGQLNFTYGKGKSEEKFINNFLTQTSTFNEDYTQIQFGLFPGLNYKLSKHFYLDLRYGNLEYSSVNLNTEAKLGTLVVEDELTRQEFSVNLGFETLKLGMVYSFK